MPKPEPDDCSDFPALNLATMARRKVSYPCDTGGDQPRLLPVSSAA